MLPVSYYAQSSLVFQWLLNPAHELQIQERSYANTFVTLFSNYIYSMKYIGADISADHELESQSRHDKIARAAIVQHPGDPRSNVARHSTTMPNQPEIRATTASGLLDMIYTTCLPAHSPVHPPSQAKSPANWGWADSSQIRIGSEGGGAQIGPCPGQPELIALRPRSGPPLRRTGRRQIPPKS